MTFDETVQKAKDACKISSYDDFDFARELVRVLIALEVIKIQEPPAKEAKE